MLIHASRRSDRALLTCHTLLGKNDLRGFVEDAEDTGSASRTVVNRAARQSEMGFALYGNACDRKLNIVGADRGTLFQCLRHCWLECVPHAGPDICRRSTDGPRRSHLEQIAK